MAKPRRVYPPDFRRKILELIRSFRAAPRIRSAQSGVERRTDVFELGSEHVVELGAASGALVAFPRARHADMSLTVEVKP